MGGERHRRDGRGEERPGPAGTGQAWRGETLQGKRVANSQELASRLFYTTTRQVWERRGLTRTGQARLCAARRGLALQWLFTAGNGFSESGSRW